MSNSAIVLPVVVQALLSILVLVGLGQARAQSMRERRQSLTDEDLRLSRNVWSDQAQKVANNYRNQFELPVLFFAVVAFVMILRQADAAMLWLAWIFVAARVAHAVIHIGPNVVKWRAITFLIGAIAVSTMWIVLGWRAITGV